MLDKHKLYLNYSYDWFTSNIQKSIKESTSMSFEDNFDMFLCAITENNNPKDHPLVKNELFYTCRISIKNKQNVILRITSDFIRIIFHDLFGSNYPVFDLEKLTELEQQILNSYFEYLVKKLSVFLISDENPNKINPLNKLEATLIFNIKHKEMNTGKLLITLPLNRCDIKFLKTVDNFSSDSFLKNSVSVDILTGYAKISLEDLKNLSRDDIILLEKSNIKKMTLKVANSEFNFEVNPDPSLIIDLEDDVEIEDVKDDEYKEEIMPENKMMWDDIQIEVSAEFQKVKMCLGDLKQITKGVVIDVGTITDNEISLFVEDKIVAKGELVIINDKYGVKITEVYADKKENIQKPQIPPQKSAPAQRAPQPAAKQQTPPQKSAPAQRAPQPAAKPQAQANNVKEDFDYSNFEE